MNPRIDTERILDAFLAPEPDRLPDRVIDAALAEIAGTPQRRAVRVPWRFPNMSNVSSTARAVLVGAVLLLATVGATYLVADGKPSAIPTEAPASSAAPTPSRTTGVPTAVPTAALTLPPGITGWKTYISGVRGFTFGYPADWSLNAPATRTWQRGDSIRLDEWPYADTFISPERDAVGLLVWEMPEGDGFDVETVEGLKAWAQKFCSDVEASSCQGFTQRATPMCLNAGGDSCRAAILVPTAEQQYAFFVDWSSARFTNVPDLVRVVVVAREDTFPSAARYGGSVALLKAVLTTMDVWTPGQQPSS